MVIMATRRKAHYLAKDGHFVSGPRKWLMNATGQIETHRESGARSALSSAVALLEADKAVGIFPEGTRSKRTESPYLQEGKTGVARLADALAVLVAGAAMFVACLEVVELGAALTAVLGLGYDAAGASAAAAVAFLRAYTPSTEARDLAIDGAGKRVARTLAA